MKVLIFGDASSIWIKKVIEHTLLEYNDEVTVISTTECSRGDFMDYYRDNAVIIIPYKKLKGKMGTVVSGLSYYGTLKKQYDIFCVHYVENCGLCFMAFAKWFCKRTILFFWGSDLLREGKQSLLRRLSFYWTDYISVCTKEMMVKFHDLYGHKYDAKIVDNVSFGVNGLDILAETKCEKNVIKKRYNIEEDKVVIAIGHNRFCEQQHILVLEEMLKLPDEARSRMHLIFRLTYGYASEKYIQEIKNSVYQTGCSCTFFEDFMDEHQIADITAITDIFIQAQTTDARSSTMLEHLYAQCLVVNPAWIKYSELEDKLFYLTFDRFEQLRDIIQENMVLKEKSRYLDKLIQNRDIVSKIGLWENVKDLWRDLYTRE